ncbi:MAG: LexA family protein [Paraclostridium sp.]
MTTFGSRLHQMMKRNKITQQELADKLNVRRGSVSNWVTDRRRPDSEILVEIARIFDVSTDYLLGSKTDNRTGVNNIANLIEINNNKMVKIPVLGVIKAGIPMFSEENIIDYEYVHQEELMLGEKYFYLQVKGDSMINARIYEGDRVRIKKQNFTERDGDIMAVRVNGDEVTLKRVYKQDNGLVLISENQNYAPMFFPASDIEIGYVSIVGKVVKIEINIP